MKVDIQFTALTGKYVIKRKNGCDYIVLDDPDKISRPTFILKNNLDPALKDFIRVDTDSPSSILTYCCDYGLPIDSEYMADYLSRTTAFLPIEKNYKEEHFDPFGGRTNLPVPVFFQLNQMICDLFYVTTISRMESDERKLLDESDSSNISVLQDDEFEDKVLHFLNLLLQPKKALLPQPFNYHIEGEGATARLSNHFLDFANYFHFSDIGIELQEFFTILFRTQKINLEYKRTYHDSSEKKGTAIHISNQQHDAISVPNVKNDILYICEQTSADNYERYDHVTLDSLIVPLGMAFDSITEEYRPIIRILKFLKKHYNLCIDSDCNIHIAMPESRPENYVRLNKDLILVCKKLVSQIILSYTQRLKFSARDDIYLEKPIISVNSLLQYMCLNIFDAFSTMTATECHHPGCHKLVISKNRVSSLKENLKALYCEDHYQRYQKRRYRIGYPDEDL